MAACLPTVALVTLLVVVVACSPLGVALVWWVCRRLARRPGPPAEREGGGV